MEAELLVRSFDIHLDANPVVLLKDEAAAGNTRHCRTRIMSAVVPVYEYEARTKFLNLK